MINTDLSKVLYDKNKSANYEKILQENPTPKYPIVTTSDAEDGYLTRYFIRPVNDKTTIMEIDKIQYEKFKTNPRFLVASLRWKIVGQKKTMKTSYGATVLGVEDINRNLVSREDLTFGGLILYIQNYLEYWVSET